MTDKKELLKQTGFLQLLAKPIAEHWLIMIKPFTPISVVQRIYTMIREYGLVCHETNVKALSKKEVESGFGIKPLKYQEFLCCGTVQCIVVYGENAAQKSLVIKERIRLQHHLDSFSLNNYIHVPEGGAEFKVQMDLFFPRYAWVGSADLHLEWCPDILHKLYDGPRTVFWVGIAVAPPQFETFAQELKAFSKEANPQRAILPSIKMKWDEYVFYHVLSPWDLDEFYKCIRSTGNYTACKELYYGASVLKLPWDKQSLGEKNMAVECASKQIAFDGLYSFGPQTDSLSVEENTTICYNKKLFEWGGSVKASHAGDYVTPKFKLDKFLYRFKNL